MANYNAFISTNYFSVTDEERFRQIIDQCDCEDEVVVFEDDSDSGKFGFGCYGSIFGIYTNGDEDEDLDSLYSALQEVLVDDDVIIITEIGYEKLRYLIANAVIITKRKIACVDLRSETFKLAGEILGVENFSADDQY